MKWWNVLTFGRIKRDQQVLDLDYQKFEKKYYAINEILSKNKYFLWINLRIKTKIHYITFDLSHKKEVGRTYSSCSIHQFNGFFILRIENEREIRKFFLPINIIYETAKNDKENKSCYFSDQINLAFRATFSEEKKSDMA